MYTSKSVGCKHSTQDCVCLCWCLYCVTDREETQLCRVSVGHNSCSLRFRQYTGRLSGLRMVSWEKAGDWPQSGPFLLTFFDLRKDYNLGWWPISNLCISGTAPLEGSGHRILSGRVGMPGRCSAGIQPQLIATNSGMKKKRRFWDLWSSFLASELSCTGFSDS